MTAVDDYIADIFLDGETVTTIGKTLDMEADVLNPPLHETGVLTT